MKTSWFYLMVILSSLLLVSSCKKDLLDVTEEFYIQTSIDVTGNNADFIGEEYLDAVSSSELIEKYSDKIKSIEVTEIRYYLSYFNGSATQQINSGTLKIGDESGYGISEVASLSNVNLLQAAVETELPFNSTAMQRFADLIKNDPHTATVYLEGTVNETPVDFTVVFKFKIKMVANPL